MIPRLKVGKGVSGAVRYALGEGRDPKTMQPRKEPAGDRSRVEWVGGMNVGFAVETAADADLAGTQFSEHVRELCLRRASAGVVAGTRRNPQARALMRELTAIGNNLNQLTRIANTTKLMPQHQELSVTTDMLKAAFKRVLDL